MNAAMYLAIGLLTLGGLIAIGNWFACYKRHRIGYGHSSILLIGGVLLVAGMRMLPATRPYAWAGLFLDYGTLIFVLYPSGLAYDRWRTSRYNLLSEYVGRRGSMTACLRLSRKGRFLLVRGIDPQPGTSRHGQLSLRGTWRREGNRLILRDAAEIAILEAVEKDSEALQWTTGFPSTERNEKLSLAGINLSLRTGRSV